MQSKAQEEAFNKAKVLLKSPQFLVQYDSHSSAALYGVGKQVRAIPPMGPAKI